MKGVLVGDSCLLVRNKNTANLKLQDNSNLEYVNWKLEKLFPFLDFKRTVAPRGYKYVSSYSYELSKVKEECQNRNPLYLLDNLTPLSLAVWIMDNGKLDMHNSHMRYTISVKRFKGNSAILNQIVDKFSANGWPCSTNLKEGSISFNKKSTVSIANYICRYVPPCMQYKLPPDLREKYEDFALCNNPKIVTQGVAIKEIRIASNRQMRNKRKFDISVKDHYSYMVGGSRNGVVVHNSPETTAGGNALKFYASVRLDIRRTGSIKDDKEVIANSTRVKVVKNKTFPPFKQAEFQIIFGKGIDLEGNIIEEAIKQDFFDRRGSWFWYKEERLANGLPNLKKYLEEHSELYEEIKERLA